MYFCPVSSVMMWESMTQRLEPAQHAGACASIAGASACVHGPVGLSLVATPIALWSPSAPPSTTTA
jgi:hypothetical protein